MHELVDLIGWKSHYYLYSAVLYDANAGAGPEHNSETGNLLSVNPPAPCPSYPMFLSKDRRIVDEDDMK